MRSVYMASAFALAALASCNSGGRPGHTASEQANKPEQTVARRPESKLGEAGTGKLILVVGKYYELKNALVATQADNAYKAAALLKTATDSLQAYLQGDPAANPALHLYLDTIANQSYTISAMKDMDCEKYRIYFEHISSAMYGLAKGADLKNAGIYRQYCPMAFNEKGAYWLSAETEIKNPYFGKKMLECGELTDSL